VPVIVVTRLRLKDLAFQDEFFTAAVAVLEQAKSAEGNLGTDALADANNVWWTLTAWSERRPMHAFVGSEPHRSTMRRIDDWCDEATFAAWEHEGPGLPDWQTSYQHLIADGQSTRLTDASEAQLTRAFPAPVQPG
jgi:hypothetical protein